MNWLLRNWWLIFPAWLVGALILGPLIGRLLRRQQPPVYVPHEWVAEYRRKNQHPGDCKCRACAQHYPRPGGAL